MNNKKVGKFRLHKIVSQLVKTKELDFTSPEIMRNIENFGVYVDNTLSHNRLEWVYALSRITIDHWPIRTHGDFSQIQLIREEKDFRVFFKPPEIVIEAGSGHKRDNFLNWLISNYPEQLDISVEKRFGLVHRLDKDTQGLVLIARTPESYDHLKRQFQGRTIQKKYLAVLAGVLSETVDITTYNARDEIHPTRQKAFLDEKEAQKYNSAYRLARSIFKPLYISKQSRQTLVEVQIFTGRMHQIRLQAELLGHSLVGDEKYGKKSEYRPRAGNRIKDDPLDIGSENFEALKNTVFLPSSFYLLANSLEFENLDGMQYFIQLHDIFAVSKELNSKQN